MNKMNLFLGLYGVTGSSHITVDHPKRGELQASSA